MKTGALGSLRSALFAGLLSAPVLAGGALGVAFYLRPMATMRQISRAGLRLWGASERTVEVDGLPVRYFEASAEAGGEAIVLLHGLGDSAETWARVMPRLARGRRVLAPDLAGFGRTPVPREGMSLSALVRYLDGFMDAVGLEQVILIGNSLGGAVAIRHAASDPGRVRRLFLLNSAGLLTVVPSELEPGTREEARELARITLGPDATVPGFLLDDLIRASRDPARRAYLRSDEPTDVREDLGRIEVPTTIIWGEQDRLIPTDHATELQEGIRGSELILLPGIAHLPQVQAPEEVLRIITERLNSEP